MIFLRIDPHKQDMEKRNKSAWHCSRNNEHMHTVCVTTRDNNQRLFTLQLLHVLDIAGFPILIPFKSTTYRRESKEPLHFIPLPLHKGKVWLCSQSGMAKTVWRLQWSGFTYFASQITMPDASFTITLYPILTFTYGWMKVKRIYFR